MPQHSVPQAVRPAVTDVHEQSLSLHPDNSSQRAAHRLALMPLAGLGVEIGAYVLDLQFQFKDRVVMLQRFVQQVGPQGLQSELAGIFTALVATHSVRDK